jgi:hypothetical protein
MEKNINSNMHTVHTCMHSKTWNTQKVMLIYGIYSKNKALNCMTVKNVQKVDDKPIHRSSTYTFISTFNRVSPPGEMPLHIFGFYHMYRVYPGTFYWRYGHKGTFDRTCWWCITNVLYVCHDCVVPCVRHFVSHCEMYAKTLYQMNLY